jgi:hypothetical protein
LIVIATVFGAIRTRRAEGASVTRRQLVIAAVVGVGSLAAVIAIDLLFL